MQGVNRDTDLFLQAQQLLNDADSRGVQTLRVLSRFSRKSSSIVHFPPR